MDNNRLRRFPNARIFVLGAATLTLFWVTGPAQAQSTATQDRQAVQGTQDRQANPGDDITRRDLARFDQFLDSHRDIAEQLRKTPSLVDDPQFLRSHPELDTYLQDHPSVKQEISQRPDTFMRLEDLYARDANLRDRDAGGQDRDADRRDADRRDANQDRDAGRQGSANQDRDADRQGAMNQDRDRDADRREPVNRDAASFDRFLDQHREIAEQVRKDPSLLDNRKWVESHPALQTYLRDNPGVRDQIRQDPNAFMRLADRDNRDAYMRDRDTGGQDRDAYRGNATNQDRDADRRDQDRDANRRDNGNQDADRRDAGSQDRDVDHRDSVNRVAANFDRFLDDHREIAEQVRRDPSLLDNRQFVDSHPALQAYLQDNPGVREQLRQNPTAFMQQAEMNDRDSNLRDHDPVRDHMASFGGFLGSHSDIRNDLSRDPSIVKDHDYMQKHTELNAYLNAHPDVRAELMANPQNFVHGAQQYNNGANGTSTGTSMNPAATTHVPKPNQ